jgi:hypothetical protein
LYSLSNIVRLAKSKSYNKDDLLAWLGEAENAYRLVVEEKFRKAPTYKIEKKMKIKSKWISRNLIVRLAQYTD